jgi:hypothetical protein
MGVTAEAKCRGGEARLLVSESPVYLKMAGPLSAVKAASPIHGGAPTAQAQVLEPMASAAAWKIGAEEPSFQNYCGSHPMEPGRFALADGTGACIRVTLASRTDLPDLVAEYAVLEPKNGPMAIPGKPDGIGVWVNGNAGWGRVVFEVTDAKGRRWSSNGWEESPGSWDMSDWEGDTTINFDGWRFISCGLPLHYPSGYYGPAFHNWRCQGDNSLTNQLAYPLQFSRLFVVMRQKLVHVTDMVAAKSSTLELRSLAATYGTADGSDR